MKRRGFLAGAVAATALIGAEAGAQQQGGGRRVRVLVPGLRPDQMDALKQTAPTAELVVCGSGSDAVAQAADADATYGFISPEVIRAGKRLRWVQQPSAGVEGVVNIPELVNSDIVLTNMQRMYAPEIADQALGYLLAFTRSLKHFVRSDVNEDIARPPDVVLDELDGKTMLIIGCGGIGSNIARRAHGFGVNVLATDAKVVEKPQYVAELHRPDAFHRLLPRADIVASAVPLTPVSRKMVGEREFGMMKKGVIFLNVSRGGVVDTDALVRALGSGQVAAAGLDVTDPEPVPKGHALWKQNIILTPHTAGTSPQGLERAFNLFRENLGRFSRGEALLNVVDKKAGY